MKTFISNILWLVCLCVFLQGCGKQAVFSKTAAPLNAISKPVRTKAVPPVVTSVSRRPITTSSQSADAIVTQQLSGFDTALGLLINASNRLDYASILSVVGNAAVPYQTRLDYAVEFGDSATNAIQITKIFSSLISNAQPGFEVQRARVGLADPLIRRFAQYQVALELLQINLNESHTVEMECAVCSWMAKAYGKMLKLDECQAAALRSLECAWHIGPAEQDDAKLTLAAVYACKGMFAEAKSLLEKSSRLSVQGAFETRLMNEIEDIESSAATKRNIQYAFQQYFL